MMNLPEIEAWVRSGESEMLELKRTTGERREAVRTICAMLNHRGGRVIFGVEPDGRIIGQMVSDRTVEEVAQELGEIEPPVFPSIERVDFSEGRQLLVVTVQVGSGQPYAYRGQAYRRVGNTSQQLSREEYNRILLERLHGDQRWENQTAEGWSLDDLDGAEITRTVEESIRRGRVDDPATRDPAEVLRGMGLMKDGRILRAATMLFGKAERIEMEMPQGLLRVARFRGKDKTEFLDNRQFHGNAFDLLLKAERFLRENLPVAGRIQPHLFERVDDPLYPPVALRAGLPSPEIFDAAGCVTVRFRPTVYLPPQRVAQNVTERQQRVLLLLSNHPQGAAVRDIAAGLGLAGTPRSLREDLTTLKVLGLVDGKGWGRGHDGFVMNEAALFPPYSALLRQFTRQSEMIPLLATKCWERQPDFWADGVSGQAEIRPWGLILI